MAVISDAAYFHEEADAILRDLGLQASDGSSGVKAEDIMDIVEGVKGIGYGLSTPEELGDYLLLSRLFCPLRANRALTLY